MRLRRALHPSPAAVAWRRTAADAGLHAVTAVMLALAAALVVAVPAGVEAAADDAVIAAAATDPARAAVVVEVPLGESGADLTITDQVLRGASRAQADSLQRTVPGVLAAPVGSLTVRRLATTLAEDERGLTSLRLVHPWTDGDPEGPAVTWTSGGPAGPPETPGSGADPAPLAVGVAGPVAQVLDVDVGDRVPAVLGGPGGTTVDVVVSGVFTPVDPTDPAWRTAPGLLTPRTTGSGPTTATDVAVLVDGAQVPALVSSPAGSPVVTTTLPVRATALRASTARATAQDLAAAEAAPASALPGVSGAPARLRTDLDDVLREAAEAVTTARARAGVLLTALLAATAALTVLAASLLTARRARVLLVLRTRGAPLSATAGEAAVESGAVAVVATAGGTAAAVLLGADARPGSLLGLVPLLVLAVLAPTVCAVLQARAVDGPTRRPTVDQPSERWSGRTRGRGGGRGGLAVELAAVVLAALALTALTTSSAARGPLAAAALPVSALAVALVGRRVISPLLSLLRTRAGRGGSVIVLVATTRLQAAARRTPALAALVLTTAGATTAALLGASRAGTIGPGDPAGVLTARLHVLAVVVAVVLSLLGALAVVLDAVATAPRRRADAVATTVLGLPRRAHRAAAVGELVPLSAAGAVLGFLTGAPLAAAAAGPLGLGSTAGLFSGAFSTAGGVVGVLTPATTVVLTALVTALMTGLVPGPGAARRAAGHGHRPG